MKLNHVIESQQFERADLEWLFTQADRMRNVVEAGGANLLRTKIMASLFYEPSTRTRLSFEAAMLRLGGSVIGTENAREFSSVSKGETLEDTIRVIGGYVDVIVLRHDEEGSAEKAAAVSPVQIINAGDGPGQHPTQAVLDTYTINKEIGKIDDLSIAMCGDLARGRTVRSLCYQLAKFNIGTIHLVSHPKLRMRDDIKEYLTKHDVKYVESEDLEAVASEVDILYQTRTQDERDDKEDEERFLVTPEEAAPFDIDKSIVQRMREDAYIMHPLPRKGEITTAVDSDLRAAYFRQAKNGLYVRMALLKAILAPEAA